MKKITKIIPKVLFFLIVPFLIASSFGEGCEVCYIQHYNFNDYVADLDYFMGVSSSGRFC
jgi:hypothetical protein